MPPHDAAPVSKRNVDNSRRRSSSAKYKKAKIEAKDDVDIADGWQSSRACSSAACPKYAPCAEDRTVLV